MQTAAGTRVGMRRLVVTAAALAAVVVVSAAPARAGDGELLGCGHQATHPFLPWLDPLPYTLVPGGDFESGGLGWKLSGGAKIVKGNEPFYVTGTNDRHSLSLPSGSSATSPAMCMGLVLPIVRFFSVGGAALSYLQVEALYTDAGGKRRSIDLLPSPLPSSSWAPTAPMAQLGGTVNLLTLNGVTSEIQLRFTPRGGLLGSGTWRIDDVYVDPWKVI